VDALRIQTAQHVEITVAAAGLGERVMAALLDLLVVGAWAALSAFVLGAGGAPGAAFVVVTALPALLYHPFCEAVFDGRTVGKDALRIRVARLDGSSAGLGAVLTRWLIGLVELWMTWGVVAMLAVLLGRTGQRLGDRAAGTAVVRVRPAAPAPAPPSEGGVRYPEAAFLSAADAQTVREVLRQARAMGRTARSERLLRRTKEAAERKMGIPPVDAPPAAFLRQVLADYERGPSEKAW